jgi:3-oxoacyl-[acyl-carrier protein] reductase
MASSHSPAQRALRLAAQLSPSSGTASSGVQGDLRLRGKTAVVTGAAQGIGLSCARLLHAAGARVVLSDIDESKCESAARSIGPESEAIAVGGDVTAPDFAEKLLSAAAKAFGSIDILVNNAGFTWDGVIHRMTDDQVRLSLVFVSFSQRA